MLDSVRRPDSLYLINGAAGNSEGTARRRGGKGDRRGQDEAAAAASGDKSDTKDETSHISVTPLAEVQSDLNPKDPLQKVVRFSPDLSLLLTGGSDGHIRVWEVNTAHILSPLVSPLGVSHRRRPPTGKCKQCNYTK